jgi:hypothetical protein
VLGHPRAVHEQAVRALVIDDLPPRRAEVEPLEAAVQARDHLAGERDVALRLLTEFDRDAPAQRQLLADAGGAFGDDEPRVEVASAGAGGELLGRHGPDRLAALRAGDGEVRLGLGRAERRAAFAGDVDHRT